MTGDVIRGRLGAFESRDNALAELLDWTFGRDDLASSATDSTPTPHGAEPRLGAEPPE
jgi:hypothetical protein